MGHGSVFHDRKELPGQLMPALLKAGFYQHPDAI